MRKFQKQQILEIIESLHLLHQEMRERQEQKEYPTVQTAFADCQEAAIQMGEAIEQMEGEGTEAVACLEQYCEKVYHLSLQLETMQAQKLYKGLESALIKAENAIGHIAVRKEVVFLPYKASMWDSLESVYLAAREDENCDAYVVPIPYYDKRPDGSLGELHYEGGEYPKNIEITDYRVYNLEERHPDFIYIHNPYDEWNNVTCVPEKYFSKKLRHCTDCLVYIPYFILGEIEPNDTKAIEGMRHFCFLPGTIYSHKVVVQSEKMRQIYIDEYIKEAKQLGLPVGRKNLEEKILGLGSPKIDKVQNTRKEDLDVPEEWLKVIKKADGTWKKIVFYNTSINALLLHDEKMLEKMKAVFRIFKEHQDETALLWRPHPLIPNTIKSMRPQLWEEYEKIVNEYRREGWGIYDDSADMDRTVVLSDAYYGDWSSVIYVYRKTGKSLLIQNVNVIPWNDTAGDNSFIRSSRWCIEDKKAWFISEDYNILFCVDMNTRRCEFEVKIPYEGANGYRMTPRCIKCEDSIFCMPDVETCIWVYQCNSQKFSKIEVNNPENTRLALVHFYIYENKIFAISNGLKKIIEIDVKKKEIENYFPFGIDEKCAMITRSGTTVYSLLNQSGQLICFDMMSKETVCYTLPDIERVFYTVCFDGEKFWMSGCRKEVYTWNPEKGMIEIIDDFPEGFGIYDSTYNAKDILDCKTDEYEVPAFLFSVAAEGYVWFIPYLTNKILYVNQKTYEVKELEIEDEIETKLSIMTKDFCNGRYVLEYVRENRYIGLFSCKNKCIFEIDAKEMHVKRYKYYYSESCLQEVRNALITENTVSENDILNLRSYLDQMLEKDAQNTGMTYKNVGPNIHKEIIKG